MTREGKRKLFPLLSPILRIVCTMGPIKRKIAQTNESFLRSRTTADVEGRPSKKARPDQNVTLGQKDSKAGLAAKTPLVPTISRIKKEEAAFPRGGSSVLTPLEYKQIQVEATRDVLFEQQSGKSARADNNGDDGENVGSTKGKQKIKGKGKRGTKQADPEEDRIKIEGLSYKVRPDCSEVFCYPHS